MLDARKGRILGAVIQEFIHSAEPVASEAVLRRADLGVSSATIRHEMSALEELGFLSQPHTSAGRVPTDRAYRFYVDSLLAEERLTPEERQRLRRQIHSLAEEAQRLIEGAARTLAEEVHYPSVVATVRPQEQVFRHLHFIPRDAHRVQGLIVTDTGVFEGEPVDLPEAVDPESLDRLSRWISSALGGLTLAEITRERLEAVVGQAAYSDRLFNYLRRWIERELRRAAAGRVVVEGASLLLAQPEFQHLETISPILSALDHAEVLAELMRPIPGRTAWVTIGSEFASAAMAECSLVAASYSVEGRTMGTLAILGPRRMRYERALPVVRFLAQHLSEALTHLSA